MHGLRCVLLACLGWVPLFGEWTNLLETDLDLVFEQAASERKSIYIAFLGKDWSVASDRFEETVLKDSGFLRFAGEHFLLCVVQGTVRPKLPKLVQARLQALVIHFEIKAYPTFLLLAPDGVEILRHGYREIEATEYIHLLRAILPPAPGKG